MSTTLPVNSSGTHRGGINFIRCGSNTEKGVVANNMMSGDEMRVGISSERSKNIQFVFNSIRIESTGSIAFHSAFDSTVVIANNNVVHAGSGHLVDIRSLDKESSYVDFNNLYTNDSKYRFDSRDFNTLEEYQLQSGIDVHSITVDPTFLSPDDLHSLGTALNGNGVPIEGIVDDIDGDLRDPNFPDIGADEAYDPVDVAIEGWTHESLCNWPSNPFAVRIANRGSLEVTSAKVITLINGEEVGANGWVGSLLPGESVEYTLPSEWFEYNEAYDISISLADPNGTFEPNQHNNTFETQLVLYKHVDLGEDMALCPNDTGSITIDAGIGYEDYKWSNGSGEATLQVTESGEYVVQVTDKNGCVSQDAINIKIPDNPTIHTDVALLCEGSGTELIATPDDANYSYSWKADGRVLQNGNHSKIYVEHSGAYSVEISAYGCMMASETISITVESCPLDITQDGNVLIAPANGTDHQWYLNGVAIPGEQGTEMTPSESGIYTVVFTRHGGRVTSNPVELTITSIEHRIALDQATIYPNPTRTIISIHNMVSHRDKAHTRLYDFIGRPVAHSALWNGNILEVDPGDVSAGIYFLTTTIGSQTRVFKVLITD